MLETALTQTGSLDGDLSFFLRPTDDLPNNGGGAPPFPYVLAGTPGSVVKPGAVEFASVFRNPEIHQAVAAVEETLPGHFEVTASALISLGRRLPISIDTNLDPSSRRDHNLCGSGPSWRRTHQSLEDHGSLLRFLAGNAGPLPLLHAGQHRSPRPALPGLSADHQHRKPRQLDL